MILLNFLSTFTISHKYQVPSIFIKFHAYIYAQFERRIKSMHCNNGKEFDNHSLHHFSISNGITFRFSYSYTSSQNGKVKCKIRTINNIIQNLLSHTSVPSSFLSHGLQMVTYLLNILPSRTRNFLTPTQLLYHKSSYHHLRFF